MSVELIEKFLREPSRAQQINDEEACYQGWQEFKFAQLSPTEMALSAGLWADRPAWVFVAGYQAAVRAVFPEVDDKGWVAFAATENKDERDLYPGTWLQQNNGRTLLNGYKSWVAQSRQVDQIVVTVNTADGQSQSVLVDREASGVRLDHRQAPKFLAAMSQGFAAFEDVAIKPKNVFSDDRRSAFLAAEPKFVLLASAAFLLTQVDDEENDNLVALVLALADYCRDGREQPQTLVKLDRVLRQQASHHQLLSKIPDWENDSRLFSMYSSGLQRRADKKR